MVEVAVLAGNGGQRGGSGGGGDGRGEIFCYNLYKCTKIISVQILIHLVQMYKLILMKWGILEIFLYVFFNGITFCLYSFMVLPPQHGTGLSFRFIFFNTTDGYFVKIKSGKKYRPVRTPIFLTVAQPTNKCGTKSMG